MSLPVTAQISRFSGVTFDSPVFAGGGSKGALWSQILSDVTGLPVRVPAVREATALGCAIAAGTGAGLYSDMAGTGEKLVSWHRVFTPIRHIANCTGDDGEMAIGLCRPAGAGRQRADHLDVAGARP